MFFDWDGNGRIDPVDVGISIAAENMHEEPERCEGERIALISCSKSKRPYPCRASELYSASTLFSLSYEYALANADRIYIISAKHGLLAEDEVIEPYNETLNEKSAAERRAWARGVLEQLRQECDVEKDEFLILAGKRYYEYLLPELPHATLPLGNLPMGKRIEFLQRAGRASTGSPGIDHTGADYSSNDYPNHAPKPEPLEQKKPKTPLFARRAERPKWGGKPLFAKKSERPKRGEEPIKSEHPKRGERSLFAKKSERPKRGERPLFAKKSEQPKWGEEPLMELKEGDRVCHEAFGNGTVISVQSMAARNDAIVEIAFDERGRKRLLLSVAGRRMTVKR